MVILLKIVPRRVNYEEKTQRICYDEDNGTQKTEICTVPSENSKECSQKG